MPSQVPPTIHEKSSFSSDASPSQVLNADSLRLLNQIQRILADKAPEAIGLLEEFVSKLPLTCRNCCESDKRARSAVFHGIPEPDSNLPSTQRHAYTEKYIAGILDTLDIETRPIEISRMGKAVNGKPRLVKCVFSDRRYLFQMLSPSRKLRSSPIYAGVFVRKSMAREERDKEAELRKQAQDLNQRNHGGSRVFVVYRGEVVRASDIQRHPRNSPAAPLPKN
ncbi:hypothetical protein Q1695_007622 [Nippostrongylus brasiliensis]|nr:hypothetical protein Q1695_007622 [Nippostrongylus brasiliensis]